MKVKFSDSTRYPVGKKDDRITFKVFGYEMTACWNTPYGMIYLYTFRDEEQNIYIWKTSKLIEKNITCVSGRIKEHLIYGNITETELYYCRVK